MAVEETKTHKIFAGPRDKWDSHCKETLSLLRSAIYTNTMMSRGCPATGQDKDGQYWGNLCG